MIIRIASLLVVVLALLAQSSQAQPAHRPNFLWIVSEDNDPFLGCYGDAHARTPNLDKLAADGVLYQNAFANAPVCAPSRCTLITGMYASSLGTMHMRSQYQIPQDVRPFTQLLREAGYYCTNPGKKTDFNFSNWQPRKTYDGQGDWSGRKSGQPFFCVYNFMTTHESCLHGSTVHEEYLKEDFQLPPYHPDTPEIRSNWVEYYHKITRMDEQAGDVIRRLEADGLADDTIVFYFSDHGGILPRSKRFCYDSGLHVPLIIRFGKNFQNLAPGPAGSRLDRLVSFIDITPSILGMAGVAVPSYMQGEPFLGPNVAQPRQYTYGFRNRMDETYDMMRTIRDKQFRYVRNYMPHRIYGEHLNYLWLMPATVSWEREFRAGRCNELQSVFWNEKPSEELYDELADHYEIHNLAEDPKYENALKRLRQALHEHLLKTRDTGFLPETEMVRRAAGGTIRQMAVDENRYPLAKILEAAEVATRRDPTDMPQLLAWMKDSDHAMRYWAAMGCCVRKQGAAGAASSLPSLLNDPSPPVRIMAAESLCWIGHSEQGLAALMDCLSLPDPMDKVLACNSLDALGEIAKPAIEKIKANPPHGTEYLDHLGTWLSTKFDRPAPLDTRR